MSPLVRYSFRFIIFILVQYVLGSMEPLGNVITPYIYHLFILWLPFSLSRISLLFIAAVYGIALSFLLASPGIHGATCVLIAYARPYLLKLLLVKDVKDLNYAEPSVHSLGFTPYATYVITLTIIHHIYLIILEWLSVGQLGFFVLKIILSAGVSILLIAIVEMLVQRKQKTRSSLR